MPEVSRNAGRRTWPLWAAGAGLVLIAVAIALALPTSGQSGGTPAALPADPGEVARVSLSDAKAALDHGEAVFLDVRYAEDYAAGHIPGALSIPLTELETRLGELDRTDWIITYCT
jgi:3-mercaptopyruvate sulfurtransferase SseA